MATNDPDAIRHDIERTRADLSQNVDALGDKVNPGNIAQRQGDKVRGAVTDAKDKVFGSASDAAGSVRDRAGHAGGMAQDAPHRVKDKAEGNPLAAGLIAFGAGLLAAGLIPSSRKERELVGEARDSDALSKATEEVKSAAQDTAEQLREPAQQAVQEVKDTATEGVEHVREEGTGAAQDVKSEAQDSAGTVRDSR
ncbi:Protein of unknown function [Georgenia satyanarayanai]|uniref:DUF3618 domain-containing protein n=1 Tax=Georgenia satyanarayanai TaxID=860221 RepID=A0A2Y9AHV8_9MICO|nr:DUF3618 domain-containing protein [Georgenia satyanarayanai]PYF99072.1 uncharacterized protein DUF3618 [Georgenia satyanarayanai]SSA44034.1 Protein of unknown function [Georgenia satyanarayanai]